MRRLPRSGPAPDNEGDVRSSSVSIQVHNGNAPVDRLQNAQSAGRRRLGELLLSHQLITDEQLQHALAAQRQLAGGRRRRLGQVVVDKGYLSESQLAKALADLLSLELVDLSQHSLELSTARTLPRRFAERHGMLVIGRQGHVVRVATADPTNVVALDDVKLYTGATAVTVVVATDSQIQEELRRAWAILEQDVEMANVSDDAEPPVADDHDLE